MSSWALLALAQAAATVGTPITAEQAIKTYQQTFDAVPRRRCAAPERPDELVVCGRPPEADRLPLPVEPEPGAPPVGETGAGRAAAAAGGGGCLRLCHQPVQIDVIGTSIKVVNGIKRLLEGDD